MSDQAVREAVEEPAFQAALPILDPHHHLTPMYGYGPVELLGDLESGHNIRATVHMEVGANYRETGPEHLRPVGETEALPQSAYAGPGRPRICAGIVGAADLAAGEAKTAELLEAHAAAAGGRLRGVRTYAFVDFDVGVYEMTFRADWDAVTASSEFLSAVGQLARSGLSLDLCCRSDQLPRVAELAGRFPEMAIVVNHMAPPPAEDRRDAASVTARWRRDLDAVRPHANVYMKLGGCLNVHLGMPFAAMRELIVSGRPATSEEIVQAYRPLVAPAIEAFGPARCMFESNFPVERPHASYRALWNAFKVLAQPYSDDERRALFLQTAATVYRIEAAPSAPTRR